MICVVAGQLVTRQGAESVEGHSRPDVIYPTIENTEVAYVFSFFLLVQVAMCNYLNVFRALRLIGRYLSCPVTSNTASMKRWFGQ